MLQLYNRIEKPDLEEAKYTAFISYSHRDEASASWLHKSLETYRIPKHLAQQLNNGNDRLSPIFRDRDELASSSDLSSEITRALGASNNLIVLCSQASATSQWVDKEIRYFKSLGKSDRIFCCLIDDPSVSFPAAVLHDIDGDGNTTPATTEPLAADARNQGDGRRLATLKLIAGLIGVGFDQLVQRENQRRQRRLLGLAVGAILGMAVTAGLALTALFAQREAVAQRTVAESERSRAEVETEKAQAVSSFMQSMFEAANPFFGGRKNIQLIEALDQRVAQIEKSFAQQPVIQAAVKHTVGLNYLALQEFEKAEALLSHALALRIEHLTAQESDISESYLALSDLRRNQGQYDKAKESASKALSLTKQRAGEQSMEVVPMLDELAQVHLMMGEFDLAKAATDEALSLRRNLSESDAEIAQGLHNRADVDAFALNYALAEPYAQEALALRRKAADLPVSIMYSLNLNANIAMALGRLDDAEGYFNEAISIATQELGEKHGETALLKENLGNVRFQQKRYDETLLLLKEVLAIRQSSFGENHDLVGRTNANMGSIYMMLEQRERAQDHLEKALTVFESVLPPNHPNLAYLLSALASNETAQGMHESAMARLKRALKIQIEGFGADTWQVGVVEQAIGETLISSAQLATAKVWLRAALDKFNRLLGADNAYTTALKEILSSLEET